MQWEFTADYSLVDVHDEELVPSRRCWFVKHFCDLTPTPAFALRAASDHPQVLLTAFRGLGSVRVEDGSVRLSLSPNSLLTLTGRP
jgi:hypothetical protein